MNKEEYIAKHGEAAYAEKLAQANAWNNAHPDKVAASSRKWSQAHLEKKAASHRKWEKERPEQAAALRAASNAERSRKGGKHHDKNLEYNRTGLRGERAKVRHKDGRKWQDFKRIIAPDSQLQHEWFPDTVDYRGLALVEADQHMHGFIDVIEVLEGKITLFTEKEVAEQKPEEYEKWLKEGKIEKQEEKHGGCDCCWC